MASSIAEHIKQRLEAMWETVPDKSMKPRPRYAAAVATVFVEFVAFTERMFRALAGRVGAIEQQLAAMGAPVQSETAQAPANGAMEPVPGASTSGVPADLVRIDAMGQPLSPQDQAMEEKVDMQLNGSIDMSRYRPRASFAGGPPTAVAAAPPPQAQAAPPPASHPPVNGTQAQG